jgi:hypothetical protein
MEIIHPPGGYFQRKEWEKSPSKEGKRLAQAGGLQPGLDYPVLPPMRFSSMFSVGTSFPGRLRPESIIQWI